MPRIQITKPDGYLGNPHGSVHTVPDDDANTLYQLGVAVPAPEPTNTEPNEPNTTWKSFLANVVSAARLTPEQRKAAIDLLPGTTGGYLVPATLADDVLHALDDRSVIRPGATVLPMTSESLHVPAIDQSIAPTAGNTGQFAGFTLAWRGPTGTRNTLHESTPAFRGLGLQAHELQAYVVVSSALNADSPALSRFMPRLFADAAAWAQDLAFLRGTGQGQPLGLLNWQGLIPVTRSAASAFALADVAAMLARFLTPTRPETAAWIMHPSVFAKVLTMTGGSNVLHCIADPRTGRARYLLAGYEICVTEKLPGLNTIGDVLLVDRAKYLIADRSFEVDYSPHARLTTGQGVWRFVCRVDGQPWLRKEVTLSDGTTTQSPAIALAAG